PIPSLLALGFALPLACQQVQVSVKALTPLQAQVQGVTGTTSVTQAAGALPWSGNLIVSPAGGFDAASVVWMRAQSATHCEALIEHSLTLADPALTTSCSAGPHELLIEFAASAPIAARLELAAQQIVTAGATAPSLQLDLGNDGSIDIVDLGVMPPTTQQVVIGLQPLRLRLLVDATLTSAGLAQHTFVVRLLPDNDLTIQPTIASCRGGDPLPALVEPTFADRGLRLWQPFVGVPAVMVVGLAPQPTLLSLGAFGPCFLLPTPDFVLFEPSGFVDIALPAAARPLTFYAQSVLLEGGSLVVGDGYTINAH
ncbi:MAG: hypothetical protein JNN13_17230, partial [Planctomycetes bacterium]|nr:hypothetical protein [Planctomycetota bacterium]